jgi:hypothetical protein
MQSCVFNKSRSGFSARHKAQMCLFAVICTLGKSVRVEINRVIFSHETTSIILRLSGDDDYLSDHTGTQDGPWRKWHEDRRSI